MAASWGQNYRLTLFGESHGAGVGIVIDGLPAGLTIDEDQIDQQLERRRPGRSALTSSRAESDAYQILSGLLNGVTTGAPLMTWIPAQDQRSRDYEELRYKPRPGHADYSAYIKYQGFNDYRGGGLFSGRLTAPLVFAGALARQILATEGIIIGGHITEVGDLKSQRFNPLGESSTVLTRLAHSDIPVINDQFATEIRQKIRDLRDAGDSCGGLVEAIAINVPAGLGEPFFRGVESVVAGLMFAIPAVVSVEFGRGKDLAQMQGSQANDPWAYADGAVVTTTNQHGGSLGGISTGMPIIVQVAFKPTSSIALKQKTIDLRSKQNTDLVIEGRHDPCIALRAVPVVEAVLAISLLEFFLTSRN